MKTITKKEIRKNIEVTRKGFSEYYYVYKVNGTIIADDNSFNGATKKSFINKIYLDLNK